MKLRSAWLAWAVLCLAAGLSSAGEPAYAVVGTGQTRCYDGAREIPPPAPGRPFHGQDAQHPGRAPFYKDNGDGTVSDRILNFVRMVR